MPHESHCNDRCEDEQHGGDWAHGDGKGFNLKFDLLPLNGAEIVLREPRSEGGDQ